MLAHLLSSTWRGFVRHPVQVALSVAVLALGLSCFVAVGLFVNYLDGFDREFPKSDRIFVVYQSFNAPVTGRYLPLGQQTALPVAEQLRIDVPELDAVARFAIGTATLGAQGTAPVSDSVAYADPEWTDIFDLDVLAGDIGRALARPRSAVLTAATAQKLFGTDSVVGKTVTLTRDGGNVDLTVAAVVDVPRHSHLSSGEFSGFGVICSWDVFEDGVPQAFASDWLLPYVRTYVLLPADGSLTAIGLEARLLAFANRPLREAGATIGFAARPVSQLVTDDFASQIQGSGRVALAVDLRILLLGFGALILGIACVNFINLATARTAVRAREIGVRKSLGATVRAVVYQDLQQTAAMALIATLLAIPATYLAMLPFGERVHEFLAVPWSAPSFWLALTGLVVVVTLAAGLYPALVLARVKPATALRLGTSRAGRPFLRTLLVGVQFASAAFLSIAVVIAYQQTKVVRDAALGRFPDQYVVLSPTLRSGTGTAFDVLSAELGRGPGIKGIAGINFYPWQTVGSLQPVGRSPDADSVRVLINNRYVTHNYFALMDTRVLAGRVFSQDLTDDVVPKSAEDLRRRTSPPRVVLDRRAAAELGWSTPGDAVGQLLYPVNFGKQAIQVIGVVESQPLALRSRESNAFAYALDPQAAQVTLVRVDNSELRAALNHVDDVWRRLAPDTQITRQFLDETFERAYAAFDMANRVTIGFASFAITIAAVGLLGMAGFLTTRRTREIGLRKTQGARSASILRLLLWDFSRPVVIANLAVWPLAYISARLYLGLFIERAALTPLPFAMTIAGTLFVTWLVVGAHVLDAARLSPTVALRHE